MAINFTSNRFAQSLYLVSKQKNNVFDIKSSLEELVNLYRKNPEFRFILLSKRIEKSQKILILKKSLNGKVSGIALEILEVLLDKDSIKELPAILNKFRLIVLDKTESAQVTVTVSNSMDDKLINDLKQSIEAKLNKKIDIQLDVDPSLIGGMVLRINNTIIDGSIKRRLEKIREHLVLN
jgi:F-type H+-transporting ATPase subunit delta